MKPDKQLHYYEPHSTVLLYRGLKEGVVLSLLVQSGFLLVSLLVAESSIDEYTKISAQIISQLTAYYISLLIFFRLFRKQCELIKGRRFPDEQEDP
jgi:hypothetical protein